MKTFVVFILSIVLIGSIFSVITAISSQINGNEDYAAILANSWNAYKKEYIQHDGRVIDNSSSFLQSTSEGQSYALLRAVEQNDQSTFNAVEKWTFDNMAVRKDKLLAWRWGRKDDGSWGVLDLNSATDGDEQTAWALFAAYDKWHDSSYLQKGIGLARDIYKYDTSSVNNQKYVIGGNWANDTTGIGKGILYIDPSYLEPAAYRIFNANDPSDDWTTVMQTSLNVLEKCTFDKGNKLSLPPDWCIINKATMGIVYTNPSYPPVYSYDAFRTYYNLAIDCINICDAKEIDYLDKSSTFLQNQSEGNHIGYTYNLTTGIKGNRSLSLTAGMVAALEPLAYTRAADLYKSYVLTAYNTHTGQFGMDYYDANWAWFITYLLSNHTQGGDII